MEQAMLVLTNMADAASARSLARALVERRLAACVNLVPGVQSVYRWQGEVEEAEEVTLFIKTSADRYDELEQAIRQLHPYTLPEVIAVPVQAGLQPYLNWITRETRKDIHA
ncbi:divalent-cation tolerance protein CutA|uniref:divalent-cation tolerance protein CutA n=1 Tax=Noviherbaspirillum sp. L7-7A TaxID=2850560 RepID=UPI001C2C02BC|nr:divalent-cation tolerance protein CutA [Noviherbaspirillum sp. L7-7A]MBV0880992.1 divalent-cation tolerance protein CutA [Noviherbaspirillum sp. L7-7A]